MDSVVGIDLPATFPDETCLSKGHVEVAHTTGHPHKIYYELHGCSNEQVKERLIFINGLNMALWSWKRASEYFAARKGYQTLLFDNRGVGNSDSPTQSGRLYTTSGMALDVFELLDHLDWNQPHSITLVGVSMGGMIAQKLALLAPDRFIALCLVSSKSGRRYELAPWKGFKMVASLSLGLYASPKTAMHLVADTLYPSTFLNEDTEMNGKKIKREEVIVDELLDRMENGVKQPLAGRLGQLAAALSHTLSDEDVRRLGEKVPSILIITGDNDSIIRHQNSQMLHEMIPNSRLVICKGVGHALPAQVPDKLHQEIEHTIEKGRQLSRKGLQGLKGDVVNV